MTAALVVTHILVSLLLIIFVLLHAGRGSGLSEMFGGGMGSGASGSTIMQRNLDRVTVATAAIFTITTVLLALRLKS